MTLISDAKICKTFHIVCTYNNNLLYYVCKRLRNTFN